VSKCSIVFAEHKQLLDIATYIQWCLDRILVYFVAKTCSSTRV